MNLPIPMCIIEFDGKISMHNDKFSEMIGRDQIIR